MNPYISAYREVATSSYIINFYIQPALFYFSITSVLILLISALLLKFQWLTSKIPAITQLKSIESPAFLSLCGAVTLYLFTLLLTFFFFPGISKATLLSLNNTSWSVSEHRFRPYKCLYFSEESTTKIIMGHQVYFDGRDFVISAEKAEAFEAALKKRGVNITPTPTFSGSKVTFKLQ